MKTHIKKHYLKQIPAMFQDSQFGPGGGQIDPHLRKPTYEDL